MTPFVRGAVPAALSSKGPTWAQSWQARRQEAQDSGKSQPRFKWPTLHKRPLNAVLLPDLMAQTKDHCAFCDGYPLEGKSTPTIEHFRPKSTFPLEAFTWSNLYPACNACQAAKLEQWHDLLLRPDEPGYTFDRYFVFNHRNGEIVLNPGASAADQARADVTLRLFKLNDLGRPASRLNEVDDYESRGHRRPLDEFEYRFALLVPLAIPLPSP
jgi:uncharacterized protein (TIGR02646 family)